ncbi:hypothetical protein C8J57DRAFT_1368031 [Mycena rebaudengoi]|nr:hypothetical protein C8J57DRAFT_1368031 [Mycena rebaudengoi]
MPRRRRSRAQRWTHTKSKSANRQYGEPTAPKPEVWATLERHGAFIVTDEDGEEHSFKINDVATVMPPRDISDVDDICEYWVAKIKAIGTTADGEVWVEINWYYTPDDVHIKLPSFDASRCSKYERLYSHHSEVISSLTFNAVVPMAEFVEDSPEQPRIPLEHLFCRYFLDTKLKAFRILPYVYAEALAYTSLSHEESLDVELNRCICDVPYNTRREEGLENIMHWCPHPRCRRAYHRVCLVNDSPQAHVSAILFARLANSPDGEKVDVTNHDVLSRLPADLVGLAVQPIVRGGKYGIAGNVAAVVLARRVVLAALHEVYIEDADPQLDNLGPRRAIHSGLDLDLDLDFWQEHPGFSSWEDAVVESNWLSEGGEEIEPKAEMLRCPNCSGAI